MVGKRVSAAHDDKAQRLHFDARSAEALLVYLTCQGRALAWVTLAELFWPDRSQEQERTNLPPTLLESILLYDRLALIVERSHAPFHIQRLHCLKKFR